MATIVRGKTCVERLRNKLILRVRLLRPSIKYKSNEGKNNEK
nr:MAG TPA: hypothetical protein [Caudoviricetes sp.]